MQTLVCVLGAALIGVVCGMLGLPWWLSGIGGLVWAVGVIALT